MKKIMLVVMCVWIVAFAQACDACGCSVGGDGWGIMPNYNRHFAGIRLQYRTFHNTHGNTSGHSDAANLTGNDYFLRNDFMVRFAISSRWQLMAVVPYRYNQRIENDYNTVQKGLGDVALYLQYLLIKPGDKDWKHALQLSFGSEAPTGNFTFSHEIPATLQAGSGTWDWIAGMGYTLRYRKWGINIEAIQRFNGYTKTGYDWGNSSAASGRLFYSKVKENKTWMPWIGVATEYFESNIENMKYQIRAAYTGGYHVNGLAGLDYYSTRMMAGAELGLPVVSNLSDGSSFMRLHGGVRVAFFIQKTNSKSIKTQN